MAQLWSTRLQIRAGYTSSSADAVVQLMSDSDFTLDQILDCDIVRTAGEEVVAELRQYLAEHSIMPIRDSINVALDGGTIIHQSSDPRVAAHARDGRTMVPLRAVVTKLGADVEWEQATQGITITRAGKTVHMTLGSAVATVDGQSVQMDVAPYANDGTTFIPVRYVAEFFGQKVEWDQKSRTVFITEDKSVVGDSNLEQWALPMGAMLSYIHGGNGLMTSMVTNFGVERRGDGSCAEGRRILNSPSWGIMGREDLVAVVASMTFYGHNSSFLSDVAMIDAMPQEQYEKIISENTGMDRYMFPYTKALGEKWGDRGILCWDLFRMSNLVQWGYQAGYLTYAEALALLEPAAVLLQMNFSSWDEAYENYLDGYNWWARNNVLGQNIWETERGVYYTEMKEAPNIAPIFDDSLFDQGVIPVEGMDFASLVEEVLG